MTKPTEEAIAPAPASPPGPAPRTTALATRPPADKSVGPWATESNFALAQRAAVALAKSELVPETYRGKEANCLIALDIAYHLGISPLTVMQNLHVIHGRPSWGSSFVIGALNSCGRFSPLRFKMTKRGRRKVTVESWVGSRGNRTVSRSEVEIDDTECYAYATELATGELIEGPSVSIEMATAEGWTAKAESKWKTMPDLMLRYRAAAFFGRLYAPDVLMGMPSVEEVQDIERPEGKPKTTGAVSLQQAIDEAARAEAEPAADVEAEVVPEKPAAEAKPEPSKFCAKALEREAAGEALTAEEQESLRNYRLDLEDWEARQPKTEDK